MKKILGPLSNPVIGLPFAGALMVLGVALMVFGWPETTPTLKAMLQLSGLFLSLSIGVVLLVLLGRRPQLWDRRGFRITWLLSSFMVLLGIFLYVVAIFSQKVIWAPLAQFSIWLGFGFVAVYLIFRGLDESRNNSYSNQLFDLLDGQEAIKPMPKNKQ